MNIMMGGDGGGRVNGDTKDKWRLLVAMVFDGMVAIIKAVFGRKCRYRERTHGDKLPRKDKN